MALQCFRNTKLENLHAGTGPSSATGDYSDVKVITPFGEIPWNALSRFNDAEMKTLIIDVVNKTYTWLTALFGSEKVAKAVLERLSHADMQPEWQEPEYESPFGPSSSTS